MVLKANHHRFDRSLLYQIYSSKSLYVKFLVQVWFSPNIFFFYFYQKGISNDGRIKTRPICFVLQFIKWGFILILNNSERFLCFFGLYSNFLPFSATEIYYHSKTENIIILTRQILKQQILIVSFPILNARFSNGRFCFGFYHLTMKLLI